MIFFLLQFLICYEATAPVATPTQEENRVYLAGTAGYLQLQSIELIFSKTRFSEKSSLELTSTSYLFLLQFYWQKCMSASVKCSFFSIINNKHCAEEHSDLGQAYRRVCMRFTDKTHQILKTVDIVGLSLLTCLVWNCSLGQSPQSCRLGLWFRFTC